MSYPEPRYLGETGEVSAAFRRADHEPELTYPSGGTVHYLATGASTDGEFGLYRWDFAPAVSGPDPHFHKTISESFSSCPARSACTTASSGSRPRRRLPFVPEAAFTHSRTKAASGAMRCAVRSRCPARGLLRDAGRGGERTDAHRGGTDGVLPQARHLLALTLRLNRRSHAVVIREEPLSREERPYPWWIHGSVLVVRFPAAVAEQPRRCRVPRHTRRPLGHGDLTGPDVTADAWSRPATLDGTTPSRNWCSAKRDSATPVRSRSSQRWRI